MAVPARHLPLVVAVMLVAAGCATFRSAPSPSAPSPPPPRLVEFEATAYSVTGTTASGKQARPGTVAADPKVLPIGTRIRIQDAGRYSGEYTVADTGPAINGHEIDIFIANAGEAKAFGRRRVKVEIVERTRR
jgi:3D (Asp-Asp-Asp) domain-containing protein